MDTVEDGYGGFLLSLYAFLEFLSGSKTFQQWSGENEIEENSTIFFSAYTYGYIQFLNRDGSLPFEERQKVKAVFQLLRNSAWSSRIINVDPMIMDIAATLYSSIKQDYAMPPASDIGPYVELATAMNWNLTMTYTDRSDDPQFVLQEATEFRIEWPCSVMRQA
jgi:hypothetical protein